jgi:hypothetical protein
VFQGEKLDATWFRKILPPSQIIRRFDISKYIDFAIHLDIHYVQIHSKNNVSRKSKCLIIWNGGSKIL